MWGSQFCGHRAGCGNRKRMDHTIYFWMKASPLNRIPVMTPQPSNSEESWGFCMNLSPSACYQPILL
ncbi:hypothetical protein D5086_004621 [Populus alba]|uniref:Uncharacterized protein n=1 Tax=Populus alba TaxID=43335 RepID=A0ACC4CRQ0_POPAL